MSPAETVEGIVAYLGRSADLQAADVERFVAKGRTRVLEPGDSFCHLGQQKHEVGFIQTGIVRFYNPKRRHSTLGYLSPIEFERRARLA